MEKDNPQKISKPISKKQSKVKQSKRINKKKEDLEGAGGEGGGRGDRDGEHM